MTIHYIDPVDGSDATGDDTNILTPRKTWPTTFTATDTYAGLGGTIANPTTSLNVTTDNVTITSYGTGQHKIDGETSQVSDLERLIRVGGDNLTLDNIELTGPAAGGAGNAIQSVPGLTGLIVQNNVKFTGPLVPRDTESYAIDYHSEAPFDFGNFTSTGFTGGVRILSSEVSVTAKASIHDAVITPNAHINQVGTAAAIEITQQAAMAGVTNWNYNLEIYNNNITNWHDNAVDLGGSNIIVRNNDVSNPTGDNPYSSAFMLGGTSNDASGNIVTMNYIHDIPSGHGANSRGGVGCFVTANIFKNLPGCVYNGTTGSNNNTYANNTIINCIEGLRNTDSNTGTKFINNIFIGGLVDIRNVSGTATYTANCTSGAIVEIGGTLTDGGGNITADPLLIDPDNGDYNLQESSPSVGTGEFWWGDYVIVESYNGTNYYSVAPDMGANQSSWNIPTNTSSGGSVSYNLLTKQLFRGSSGGSSTPYVPPALAAPIAGIFNPPDGIVDEYYSFSAATSFTGGAVSIYYLNGTLPTGLSLNSSTGLIDGTPTTEQTLTGISITGWNDTSSSTTSSADIAIEVTLSAPVASGTFAPPSGEPSVYYSYITADLFTGEVASYSLVGTLPDGLSLNTSTGVIFGTPTTEETATGIAVTATNAIGSDTTNSASIVIETPIAAPIASGVFNPPDGVVGTYYLYSVYSLFTGGVVDTYTLNGTIPTGLTFNTAAGFFYGTPTTDATFSGLSITGSNGGGSDTTNTADIAIAVAAPIASGTFNPPDGVVGTDYIYTTSSLFTGGQADSYSINGTLPGGLSFSTSLGWITGTPTTEETLSGLSVTATNVTGSDTTNTADIAIAAAPSLGTAINQIDIPFTTTATGTYYFAEPLTGTGKLITIAHDDVVLDGNFQYSQYNTSSGAAVAGIDYSGAPARVTIKNLVLEHKGTSSTYCKGILPRGADWLIEKCALRDGINGVWTGIGNNEHGIYDIPGLVIRDNYIEATGVLAGTATAPKGIDIQDRNADAYAEVYRNTLAEMQWPLTFTFWGLSATPTVRSIAYQNQLQPHRIENTKGPYSFSISVGENIDFYHNRAISFNGRGLYFSGGGQGSGAGAINCTATENAIGCNFFTATKVGVGTSADSDCYGLRDRYGSGNNTFDSNSIIVHNNLSDSGAKAMATFIGSDLTDTGMVNLVTSNNITISWGPATAFVGAWFWDDLQDVTITDNQWAATGGGFGGALKDQFEYNTDDPVGRNDRRVSVTETGTLAYAPTEVTPAQVAGLALVKFVFGTSTSYKLSWTESTEDCVWAYQVYRNGTPLAELTMASRAPHIDVPDPFWVDAEQAGTVTYTVEAVTLGGLTSTISAGISTTNATNGFQ